MSILYVSCRKFSTNRFGCKFEKLSVKTYLVVSFNLVVKSVKKFIQCMLIDSNSSGLNPTQIVRPIKCD
jgi:hypothetical protein